MMSSGACESPSAMPWNVPQRRREAVAFLFSLPLVAKGRTLTVGAQSTYPTLAAALDKAVDGDTIQLAEGAHRAAVGVIRCSITLRGLGGGAVLYADGRSALGKGILVVKADATIENVEFRGARVPDGNGAGIRLDHGQLVVRDCRFFDNEHGLLASHDQEASLEVFDSVFGEAPRHSGRLHHLVYIGRIRRFTLQGCVVQGGWNGHLVKTRALENSVLYNVLNTGLIGEASYELELAEGGNNLVMGNLLAQGPNSGNPVIVAIGPDAASDRHHGLIFVHNTLVQLGTGSARFMRIWSTRMRPLQPCVVANNIFVGTGVLNLPSGYNSGGNHHISRSLLNDEFRPLQSLSHLPLRREWQPTFEPSIDRRRPLKLGANFAGSLAPVGE